MSINYDGSSAAAGLPAAHSSAPTDPLLDKGADSDSTSWSDIFVAYLNLVKVCIGAGVLALPYAFGQGGLVLSSIGMALVAGWNYYTTRLLLRCKAAGSFMLRVFGAFL